MAILIIMNGKISGQAFHQSPSRVTRQRARSVHVKLTLAYCQCAFERPRPFLLRNQSICSKVSLGTVSRVGYNLSCLLRQERHRD